MKSERSESIFMNQVNINTLYAGLQKSFVVLGLQGIKFAYIGSLATSEILIIQQNMGIRWPIFWPLHPTHL